MYNNIKVYLVRKYTSLGVYREMYKIHPQYTKSILKKKLLKIMYFIFLIPASVFLIPIVFIMRILKPIITIRLGNLESEGIGHFSLPVEIYLAELECGIHKNVGVLDVWYLNKKICNMALKEKWDQHLYILPRFMVKPIHLLNKIIPGGQENEIPYRRIEDYSDYKNPWQSIDIHNVLSKAKPKIKFTEEEKWECTKILNRIGFDSAKQYVCLSVRDGAYHGDSDIAAHRNHSVNKYVDAIAYLNELGYQVVRLGANVQESLSEKGPLIFDYATSGIRSELLDLFLISECEFYVGTGSGLDKVADLFRKRQVYIDLSQIGTIPDNSYLCIIIFRKMKIQGNVISLSSIFRNGYEKMMLSSQFKEAGIELIDQSKEEIRAVIWETHARLNGIWKTEAGDENNQDLFRSSFPEGHSLINARIGAEFLRSMGDSGYIGGRLKWKQLKE